MNKLPFLGVAYYPEAWERSQIDEDLDSMVEHGISCVRIGEFAWKTMEPQEGNFDLSLFREVVDKCRERSISVILGTTGATPPLWLSNKYPDIYGERLDGVKLFHGARQACCYNHEEYLRLARRITEKMAQEFANDENVIGWQIDNEIASHADFMFCVCPTCEKKFRTWVSELYCGDVDRFNREVGTNVFSSAIDSFEELHRPYKQWTHPAYWSLWRKFQLHTSNEYLKDQYRAIKKYTDKPVGTDMMPVFQALSYEETAKETDVMQFNEYFFDKDFPNLDFWENFIYNLKQKPFWLTETSCCWNGSTSANYMRHRGFVNANAWIALANGAESVSYWLWRTHYAGHELMHGSVVQSNGRPRHIKDEVIALSKDMDKCADLINGTRPTFSGLALMVSENSDRTFEFQQVYNGFKYQDALYREYSALSGARLSPAVISEGRDLSDIKVLYTPYLLSLDTNGLGERILRFVENGGTWIAPAMTDVRTASEAKYTRSSTGYLERAANIIIDFTLPAYNTQAECARAYSAYTADGKEYTAENITYNALIAGDGAETLATYRDAEYLGGRTAVTRSRYGKGTIVTLGFVPTAETLVDIVSAEAEKQGITPFINADKNILSIRRNGDFEGLILIETMFQHGEATLPFDCVDAINGTKHKKGDVLYLEGYDVRVLKKI